MPGGIVNVWPSRNVLWSTNFRAQCQGCEQPGARHGVCFAITEFPDFGSTLLSPHSEIFMSRSLLLPLALAFGLSGQIALAQAPGNKVLAKVNGEAITEQDVSTAIDDVGAEYPNLPPENLRTLTLEFPDRDEDRGPEGQGGENRPDRGFQAPHGLCAAARADATAPAPGSDGCDQRCRRQEVL